MATPNEVMKGMSIISDYAKVGEFDEWSIRAGHDQIWCGEYTGEKMSKEDLVKMENLSWFEDEDSWSTYV